MSAISPPSGWTMTQLNGNIFFTKDGDSTLGVAGTDTFEEGMYGAFSISRHVAEKSTPDQIVEGLFRRRMATAPLVQQPATVGSRQSILVEWTDGVSKIRSWLLTEGDGSVIEFAYSVNYFKYDESASAKDEVERATAFIASQL